MTTERTTSKHNNLGPPLSADNITQFVSENFRIYFQFSENLGDKYDAQSEWETPSVILEKLNNHPTKGSIGTWKCGDCYVHVADYIGGNFMILWRRRDDYISIMGYDKGEVCQTWIFNLSTKIMMKLILRTKDIVEYWIMEKTDFVYQKDGNATGYMWRDNVMDVESLIRYRRYISAWCEKNEKWVKRFGLPCKIYSLTEADIYQV